MGKTFETFENLCKREFMKQLTSASMCEYIYSLKNGTFVKRSKWVLHTNPFTREVLPGSPAALQTNVLC